MCVCVFSNVEYNEGLEWIKNDLSFDIYQEVNCFETTIRALGQFIYVVVFYISHSNTFSLNRGFIVGLPLVKRQSTFGKGK